jgi:hypothetical protein
MKVPVRTGSHLEKKPTFLCGLNGAPTPQFVFYVSMRPKGNSVLRSGIFIMDPGFRIQGQIDSGSRIRIRIKNLSIFNPKNCF